LIRENLDDNMFNIPFFNLFFNKEGTEELESNDLDKSEIKMKMDEVLLDDSSIDYFDSYNINFLKTRKINNIKNKKNDVFENSYENSNDFKEILLKSFKNLSNKNHMNERKLIDINKLISFSIDNSIYSSSGIIPIYFSNLLDYDFNNFKTTDQEEDSKTSSKPVTLKQFRKNLKNRALSLSY